MSSTIGTRARLQKVVFLTIHACLALAVVASGIAAQPAGTSPQDPGLGPDGKPLPGTSIPCAPIADKRQELGCYVLARQPLGRLPAGSSLSWHLDVFPDRVAAEAAKGPLAVIAEAFDRTWLFTIAPSNWRVGGGAQHVATVGPLETKAAEYTAMYLATTFRPGLSSYAHKHPGPEAWFIVSGEQCLETPDGPIRGHAGDGVAVRGDMPMIVHATGSEIRRNFALILHDTTMPVTTALTDWTPPGRCR